MVDETTGLTVYETVAEEAKAQYNETRNVLLVVGATNPEDELAKIRERVGPEMIFLVPGVGAQGGDIEKVMNAGLGDNGRGFIINSSREIIFAGEGPEFAAASLAKARETRDKINQYR
jgi:orotidine-5'-phosphate decarboxylase